MPGHTFNAWWGCSKVSPACKHCYAEALAERYGHDVWGDNRPRRFFGDAHWAEPLQWNRAAAKAGEIHLVFTNSQADVLEDREDLAEHRRRLCALVDVTQNLMWLFLTKRPENQHLLPIGWRADGAPNVAFGATTEDQEWFDKRIPHVRAAEWAAFRFLSIEPMMGRIDTRRAHGIARDRYEAEGALTGASFPGRDVDWFILGGESGVSQAKRRHLDLASAEDVADLALRMGKAVYVKQDSHFLPGQRGRLSDKMWGLKQHPPIGALAA
jgi:protein gp37